jgi:DNA-binding MarR family transcriptional regulator
MTSDDAFPPRPTLGFLLGDVSRLLRREFDRRVAHLGLSQAQWRVLARLSVCEGINQANLAEQIEIQPISLTRLIDRMQAAGWVERRPDPKDRRALRLFLTPKAQPLLSELFRHGEETRQAALDGLSDPEVRQLSASLEKMKSNLIAASDSPAVEKATGTHG